MLIVGRAVAGIGTSGIQNGGLTIIAACVPLEKRPGKKTSPSPEDQHVANYFAAALLGLLMGSE